MRLLVGHLERPAFSCVPHNDVFGDGGIVITFDGTGGERIERAGWKACFCDGSHIAEAAPSLISEPS